MNETRFESLELCAGAGGQALGLEQAGFEPRALVEVDPHACATLRMNRPHWNVLETDLNTFPAENYRNIDLVAVGLPCPPFSIAGNRLGWTDERNLFPAALRVIEECRPKAVMIENVPGLLSSRFQHYRELITKRLERLGYRIFWSLLNAGSFGVPQSRRRVLIVAVKKHLAGRFHWPRPSLQSPPSVGTVLLDLMQEKGWKHATQWSVQASTLAPTIVGGSKRHGGADLGPTRTKRAWARLEVDGRAIADSAPGLDYTGRPRLTLRMVARLQAFPDDWLFTGGKTAAYRQIGNALPPALAKVVGSAIAKCL